MLKPALIAAALGLALLSGTAAAQGQRDRAEGPMLQPGGALDPQQPPFGARGFDTTTAGVSVATCLPDGSADGVLAWPGQPQPTPFDGNGPLRRLAADRLELAIETARRAGEEVD